MPTACVHVFDNQDSPYTEATTSKLYLHIWHVLSPHATRVPLLIKPETGAAIVSCKGGAFPSACRSSFVCQDFVNITHNKQSAHDLTRALEERKGSTRRCLRICPSHLKACSVLLTATVELIHLWAFRSLFHSQIGRAHV